MRGKEIINNAIKQKQIKYQNFHIDLLNKYLLSLLLVPSIEFTITPSDVLLKSCFEDQNQH